MIDFGEINRNLKENGRPEEGHLSAYDPETSSAYMIYYRKRVNGDYVFFAPLDYLHAQPNPVEELMEEITKLDIQPSVFHVTVTRQDYLSGYTAYVEFRGGHEALVDSFHCHADTPEDALRVLKLQLEERFGKCPHCGNYKGSND